MSRALATSSGRARSGAAVRCPCCGDRESAPHVEVGGFRYFTCLGCGAIFVHPDVLARIDGGEPVLRYDALYWHMEVEAAYGRSREAALARVAEVFYYARRPIERFIDIGCGPGYLLDSLSRLLPAAADRFYGVELFPPPEDQRTKHANYVTGEVGDLDGTFDAGCCIEVIEHLTPHMLSRLFRQLAEKSNPEAMYIFNSGQPDFVRNYDPGYIDPLRRGHIMSYSLKAVAELAGPHGFTVHPLAGKTYAFALERLSNRGSESGPGENLLDRIWKPIPENMRILDDPEMGSVLRILGLETARASA